MSLINVSAVQALRTTLQHPRRRPGATLRRVEESKIVQENVERERGEGQRMGESLEHGAQNVAAAK